jgi:hypothetical protein
MATDPGLSGDTCIFMEAVAGDGGTHNATSVWWLSPDIDLTGPVSGADKADPGMANTVDVTFHLKGGNCTLSSGPESITIELWGANPSLAMAPNNPASTFHIDSIGMPIPAPGASSTFQFIWTPPSGVTAPDPRAPGHKCLIARSYPDPLTPSANGFFSPGDQHVAQHNICIVPCGGPGAARRPGPCGTTITSVNPLAETAVLDIRAVFDKKPDKHVREVVLRALRKTKGYARLSEAPPRDISLQIKDGRRKLTVAPKRPKGTFRGTVKADPQEVFTLAFTADLTGASLGDAFIIHVTQAAVDGPPHGGLTVVMVAV